MTRAAGFAHRHLLGIEPLGAGDIVQILDLADTFREISERPIKKVPTLRGRTVVNMFMEASTRTRASFEIAAKRLSADSVNISGSGSSAQKGETLLDTARNLLAMRPDVLILRHGASGAAALVARELGDHVAVVNAGDGMHEHPSQALLDCATIRKHKGRIEGLDVAIVGDIAHSRVARSNVFALSKLGARVRLCGPRTMMPPGIEALGPGVTVSHRLAEAIEGADVIMMLRIQNERLGKVGLFPGTREYSRTFGLNLGNVELARPDAIIMHPGPVNRGVELAPEVADSARSVVLDQVTYGVAVRMAILYLLGAGSGGEAS